MPLSNIQVAVLRLLASHRDPDLFHDRQERVSLAALNDASVLEAGGYRVAWLRQLPLIYTASVEKGGEGTRLEWVVDSDYRFFPTLRDNVFGYLLHPADLAMNKVMAAAGRREVRDLVDLVTIHQRILTLGAVIWAAVEKAPGFTPEGLIAEIRRNSNYSVAEWGSLSSSEPIRPDVVLGQLRSALDLAEAFVAKMPTDRAGLLFLEDGLVVEPDPDRLADYETHAGQRRGHWPDNPEISAAMFERYGGINDQRRDR